MYPLWSESMRCPTCRAVQPWSDACRRCKCDLTLLQEVAKAYCLARENSLRAVCNGRLGEALDWAYECLDIQADPAARQLAATCLLRCGQWAEARAMAAQVNGTHEDAV